MRINIGTRFDHEFADNDENENFCDKENPKYDFEMSYIRIFEHLIRFSKRNRVSYFRIFLHIDARELSPPQTFCLIIESPP